MSEIVGKYLRPQGTSKILNMPYGCFNFEECAPYKVDLIPGQYTVELWGGSGGDTTAKGTGSLIRGGLGGYVSCTLSVARQLSLYIYVGARGRASNTASYNGAGRGPKYHTIDQGQGAGGGGATDVRLIPVYDEDEEEISLKSRLMVAGAGGGACAYGDGARGGDNFGLSGGPGLLSIYKSHTGETGTPPQGGTQNGPGSGYFFPNNENLKGNQGSLGRGGGFDVGRATGAGAGGGGFYGGGSGGWTPGVVASGAAGSSFVNSSTGLEEISIEDPMAIGADGSMPSPIGGKEAGHYGDGFARITVQTGGFVLPPSCRRKRDSVVHWASLMLIGLLRE